MNQGLRTRTALIVPSILLFFALGIALALVVQAQEATITFPVEELGGCEDGAACKAFCDEPENIEACVAFAEKNNMMTEQQAAEAKKFAAAMESGNTPGGCTSEASCRTYCDNPKNIRTCLAFAGENDLMDPAEREEALKVAAALEGGAELPAGCTSKQSCEAICRRPENMKSCISFAKAAGLMSGQELEEAEKMLAALERGVTPPACGGKDACDAYCGEEEHFEECMNFAEAAGFIKPEEAAMARKTGGKGPGGCKREECKTFCENPDNQEVCTQFAIEHGLMSAEDLQRMNEGKEKMKEGFDRATPEIKECLKAAIGEEKLNQIMSGTGFPTQAIGEKMRSCFDQFGGGPSSEEGRAKLQDMFSQMPPQVAECVKSSLGAEAFDQLRSGNSNSGDISSVIDNCFQQMPRGGDMQGPPPGSDGQYGPPPSGEGQYSPPPGYDGQMPPQGGEYGPPPGYEGQMPPEGYQRPPEGTSPEYQQYQGAPDGRSYPPPSGDSYAPPPGEGAPPPPPAESAPTSVRYSAVRDMASLLWVFLGMFE